jgi:hypothetical protein|nr:MAG TPA: hypothetical protein [Ackermannviridae sp.]
MNSNQSHNIPLISPSDIHIFGDTALIKNLVFARITPFDLEELRRWAINFYNHANSSSGTELDEFTKLALECEKLYANKEPTVKRIDYVNLHSQQFITEHTESSIERLYVANKKKYPTEELLDLNKIDPSKPKSIIAFGTKNPNVIDKLLKSDDYNVRLALSMNPILDNKALSYLAKDTIQLIRLNVIQHQNFTSDIAKLFVNETSEWNILKLKSLLNSKGDKTTIDYLVKNGNDLVKKHFSII